jgi:hypothetical protein
MLEKIEGTIMSGQFTDTANIVHAGHRKKLIKTKSITPQQNLKRGDTSIVWV